jgi:5-methylcytosine-specific restriction protein A
VPHKPKVHRANLPPSRDNRRPSAQERGYTGRWQKASKAFLAAHPACVGTLPGGEECCEPATCVDHKNPHRGDWMLFWDRDNWQPLCASCHSRKTRKEDVK